MDDDGPTGTRDVRMAQLVGSSGMKQMVLGDLTERIVIERRGSPLVRDVPVRGERGKPVLEAENYPKKLGVLSHRE